MSSIGSILIQLRAVIINETAIPNDYVLIPEIAAALICYNWHISPLLP